MFVDKLQISITGDWSISHDRQLDDWLRDTVDLIELGCLRRPEVSGSRVTFLQRRDAPVSFRSLKLSFTGLRERNGRFQVQADLNPTRILSHAFARLTDATKESAAQLPEDERLGFCLGDLQPPDFFATADDVPRGFDGNDNWIENRIEMARVLGHYEAHFPPLLLREFRAYLSYLLAMQVPPDGPVTTDLLQVMDGEFRLHWGGLRVSEIETYIERAHPKATIMVQRGGLAMLAADYATETRPFLSAPTLSRSQGSVRVLGDLAGPYKLAVYAKDSDCIRFEVRRKGAGNYAELRTRTEAIARFAGIVELERNAFVTKAHWPAVFELFSGPDRYDRFDFRELLFQLQAAVGPDTREMFFLFEKLLVEGGLASSDLRPIVRTRLLRAKVIERQKIRPRDMNGSPPRYILRPPYRDIALDFMLPKTATRPATIRPVGRRQRVRISAD